MWARRTHLCGLAPNLNNESRAYGEQQSCKEKELLQNSQIEGTSLPPWLTSVVELDKFALNLEPDLSSFLISITLFSALHLASCECFLLAVADSKAPARQRRHRRAPTLADNSCVRCGDFWTADNWNRWYGGMPVCCLDHILYTHIMCVCIDTIVGCVCVHYNLERERLHQCSGRARAMTNSSRNEMFLCLWIQNIHKASGSQHSWT